MHVIPRFGSNPCYSYRSVHDEIREARRIYDPAHCHVVILRWLLVEPQGNCALLFRDPLPVCGSRLVAGLAP